MGAIAEVDQLAREVADLQRRLLGLRLEVETGSPGKLEVGTTQAFLECSIDQAQLAVPLDQVKEAILMCSLTGIPEAPIWVAGLLNYRGESVPVLDVQVRLCSQARTPLLSDLILVCRIDQRLVGLIVKAVGAVNQVDPTDVQPVSPGLPHARYLMGVLPGSMAQTLLLRLTSLMASSDMENFEK